VVDSGSPDRTLEVARRLADRVIQIAPEHFTYGRALNIGAAVASAPVHFALSAHCFPHRRDWIECSLEHYRNPQVAGTAGYGRGGPGEDRTGGRDGGGVVYQDLALLEAHPFQGLSSHAGSWRASLWERFPYNESMESAEDREWSWRVLKEGWVIALDPALGIATRHRTAEGLRHWYRISRRDVRAVATFMPLPPYRLSDLAREWWDIGPLKRRFGLRARLSPWRALSLVARYHGIRDGARVRRGKRPPWTPGPAPT
jgi:rhamnosyltransferase